MSNKDSLITLDELSIEGLIYEIRGQRVMLDFDLARIYGYTTKTFNQQIKNNADKFELDFMFRLTSEEWSSILRSKNLTANEISKRRYLPFAFTEQGIYMLMTVLRGDLATQQSKNLIRLFKSMKDYIAEANSLSSTNEVLALANQVRTNTEAIAEIKGQLSVVMDNFIDPSTYKSFLIMNGEKIESDIAYLRIYSMASESVYVIDDYIDIKTIQLLKSCREGIHIVVFSDNKARNSLARSFTQDFQSDRPDLSIVLKKTKGKFHDRYIVLDYPRKTRVFHCGASSKDGGNKVTTIMEVEKPETYFGLISDILSNEDLILP